MRGDRRYRDELADWTTPPGSGRRDGVPRQAFGPRDKHGALRELLADTPAGRVVQTVLRIGYPLTPSVATPRRPVEEVLVPAPTPAS